MYPWVFLVKVTATDVPSEAKVCNLQNKALSDEHVSGSEITVHNLRETQQDNVRTMSGNSLLSMASVGWLPAAASSHLHAGQMLQATGYLQGKVVHIFHVDQALGVDVVVADGGHRVGQGSGGAGVLG